MLSAKEIISRYKLPSFLLDDIDSYTIIPKAPLAVKTLDVLSKLYASLSLAIQSGRYCLLMHLVTEYPKDFRVDSENDEFLKQQFINSALMHYNTSFDITLECIWIGFGLYHYIKSDRLLSLNTNKGIEEILSCCTYNKIKSLEKCINPDLGKSLKLVRRKQQKIANWTNNLKHRGNIVYTDLTEERVNISTINEAGEIVYDSSKVQTKVTTEKVVKSLLEYHAALISLLEKLDSMIKVKLLKTASKSYII